MDPSNHQKHEAGRHLAVAHALLRGYSAKIVGRYRYVEINDRTAAVMLAGMGAWQITDVEEFVASTNERYVLVDVTDGATDLYIVPGEELRQGVNKRHQAFMDRVGTRPRNANSKHTKVEPVDVAAWKDRWSLFD